MLTDDPGTPGNGFWEINFLSTLERGRYRNLFEVPNVDLNYGLGSRLQLKLEIPWLSVKETGEKGKSGPGNLMAGVKWRFMDEERHGLDMSIYPQVEFNSSARSVERGIVERGTPLFLPVEASKKLGPITVNGEVGYRVVQHGADELEYGLLIARELTSRIEIMGELHGSAPRTMEQDELFVNVGMRAKLSKNSVLLFSSGRTVRSPGHEGPQYIAAVGLQFNFTNRFATAWKRRKR